MAKDDDILAEIERFLKETGMGPAAFGARAVGNGHLVGRLRRGGDIEMATWRQVHIFMAEYRARQAKRVAAE